MQYIFELLFCGIKTFLLWKFQLVVFFNFSREFARHLYSVRVIQQQGHQFLTLVFCDKCLALLSKTASFLARFSFSCFFPKKQALVFIKLSLINIIVLVLFCSIMQNEIMKKLAGKGLFFPALFYVQELKRKIKLFYVHQLSIKTTDPILQGFLKTSCFVWYSCVFLKSNHHPLFSFNRMYFFFK